jgi:hypothetical protein
MGNTRFNKTETFCIKIKLSPSRRLESIQEWSNFMKTSSRWDINSLMGKVMMGFVLAAMISSMDVVPAIAKDNDKRMEKHDNSRNENKGHERDRDRNRREYRTNSYRERVYVPPPVFIAPPPPPGIGIFFPPVFFRP